MSLVPFVSNKMEVIVGPPYLPNKFEREDSSLYAFNVSLLMAKMMEYDETYWNKEEYSNYKVFKKFDCPIYLLNRKHKVSAYHKYVGLEWSEAIAKSEAKRLTPQDDTLQRYKEWIEKYEKYIAFIHSKND